jgi:acyl-CoA synthetase (AMP-forming)/AMP-acid ligase II
MRLRRITRSDRRLFPVPLANSATAIGRVTHGAVLWLSNAEDKNDPIHSLGRASRYYPERTALAPAGTRLTFRELHDRVAGIAAALSGHGFEAGDRLALLLPNGPEYIELVYACSWLGVIAVPLNTRLSAAEIDRVLADASPRGLVRHSSLPVPTVRLSWQLVLDEQPFELRNDSYPNVRYDSEAILALIYTSGTTGRPKGVMVTHANVLSNVHNFNYWMRYREGGVYLHAAPIFHIADFPAMFAAPAFGACQVSIPKFSPRSFCETVEREPVSHTVLVPTMINLPSQFPEAKNHDLSSLEVLAYGGSPMAPELIRRTRELLPNLEMVQVYGLSETGFLTGLQDQEHTDDRLHCRRTLANYKIPRRVEFSETELPKSGSGKVLKRLLRERFWAHQQRAAS